MDIRLIFVLEQPEICESLNRAELLNMIINCSSVLYRELVFISITSISNIVIRHDKHIHVSDVNIASVSLVNYQDYLSKRVKIRDYRNQKSQKVTSPVSRKRKILLWVMFKYIFQSHGRSVKFKDFQKRKNTTVYK